MVVFLSGPGARSPRGACSTSPAGVRCTDHDSATLGSCPGLPGPCVPPSSMSAPASLPQAHPNSAPTTMDTLNRSSRFWKLADGRLAGGTPTRFRIGGPVQRTGDGRLTAMHDLNRLSINQLTTRDQWSLPAAADGYARAGVGRDGGVVGEAAGDRRGAGRARDPRCGPCGDRLLCGRVADRPRPCRAPEADRRQPAHGRRGRRHRVELPGRARWRPRSDDRDLDAARQRAWTDSPSCCRTCAPPGSCLRWSLCTRWSAPRGPFSAPCARRTTGAMRWVADRRWESRSIPTTSGGIPSSIPSSSAPPGASRRTTSPTGCPTRAICASIAGCRETGPSICDASPSA